MLTNRRKFWGAGFAEVFIGTSLEYGNVWRAAMTSISETACSPAASTLAPIPCSARCFSATVMPKGA